MKRYLGKTLGELAEHKNMFWKPIRVFVLQNEEDSIGRQIAPAYCFDQIIFNLPVLSSAVVCSADNYFGELILRVR